MSLGAAAHLVAPKHSISALRLDRDLRFLRVCCTFPQFPSVAYSVFLRISRTQGHQPHDDDDNEEEDEDKVEDNNKDDSNNKENNDDKSILAL